MGEQFPCFYRKKHEFNLLYLVDSHCIIDFVLLNYLYIGAFDTISSLSVLNKKILFVQNFFRFSPEKTWKSCIFAVGKIGFEMTDTVKNTINRFAAGFVFTADDFPLSVDKQNTVTKILNNMVAAGQIRRLCKGRFYKPQMSKFGELPPDTFQTVKDLLEKTANQQDI